MLTMPTHQEIKLELRLHDEARTLDDEWSGTSEQAKRRKLQNRLNQRAYRRRKLAEKQDKTQQLMLTSCSAPLPHANARDLPSLIRSSQRYQFERALHAADSFFARMMASQPGSRWRKNGNKYRSFLWDKLFQIKIEDFGERLGKQVDPKLLHPLPADNLLTLIQFNVSRALMSNISTIGVNFDQICLDETMSRFPSMTEDEASALAMPHTLKPTKLQLSLPHHPVWDIYPDPVFRNNILLYGEDAFDDVEFILDVLGDGTVSADRDTEYRTGMITWGEPWDVAGWEVTQHFAEKWPWSVKGCWELQSSTNKWREAREEAPLIFAV